MNSAFKNKKKQIAGWVLYDFANTSYSVIIVTVVYAIFFKQYICRDATIEIFGSIKHIGDFLWGLSGSAAMLLVALSSPFMGALADLSSHKKRFVAVYTLATISIMFGFFFLKPGMILLGSIMFIISNFGFEGGIVFYNSYLPGLVEKKFWGRLSGWGFGIGYVGSLAALLIALPIAMKSMQLSDLAYMKYAFPLAGSFFLIFSIPFFLWVKDIKKEIKPGKQKFNEIKSAYLRIISTIKSLKNYPNLLVFLVSYFLYIDGVNTVIYFGGIYARETLNFTMVDVIVFFAVIQSSAIIGAIVFGYLSDYKGPKFTIFITIVIWISVCVLAYFSTGKLIFYIVGLLAGVAVGSIQAASRTLMSQLIPIDHETEFFGFYALCGKFSSVLGPVLFGLISSFTGSQRLAILSLIFFFVAGGFLLRKVKVNS